MAANQLHQLTAFAQGKTMPPIRLKNTQGHAVDLNDFKGKHFLLFFWNSTYDVCISEMRILNDVKREFGEKLQIMGVSIDLDEGRFRNFLNSSSFDYPLVHFAYDYDMLDMLDIKSVPFFMLLDRAGNIELYPAPFPSENLIERLIRLTR